MSSHHVFKIAIAHVWGTGGEDVAGADEVANTGQIPQTGPTVTEVCGPVCAGAEASLAGSGGSSPEDAGGVASFWARRSSTLREGHSGHRPPLTRAALLSASNAVPSRCWRRRLGS
jgi:hypothetical protein